jgi:hypothetical protein
VVADRCEEVKYIMTWVCLYLLIFRVLLYISFYVLSYFIFKGDKQLARTLFLLTEGFQGRKFVGKVERPTDLNLNPVRHRNDRFKEGGNEWVPPEETEKAPQRSGSWIFGSRNRLESNQDPDWEELSRVQAELSQRVSGKGC